MAALLEFRPRRRGSDLNAAINAYLRLPFRKGMAFLISDFTAPDFELSLKTLAVRSDVVPVIISDPREKNLLPSGFVELYDLETDERLLVDTLDRDYKGFFESTRRRHDREMRGLFEGAGLDVVEISTSADRDPFEPLRRFFYTRKR